jgi:hypothetical protein
MTSLLLIWSISLTAGSEYLTPPPVLFGVAPELPKIREGLPPAVQKNEEVCYPWVTFEAVSQWVQYARQYPKRICQPMINHVLTARQLELDAQDANLRAAHQRELERVRAEAEAEKGSAWTIPGIVLGVLVLGVAAGYSVGKRF